MTILYFGCIKRSGHFLFDGESGTTDGARFELSHGLWRALDGAFCPPGGTPAQRYMVSVVPPWTIISWWDYSIDIRPGSHSTFLFKTGPSGDALALVDHNHSKAMLEHAKKQFPSVFARQPEPTPL